MADPAKPKTRNKRLLLLCRLTAARRIPWPSVAPAESPSKPHPHPSKTLKPHQAYKRFIADFLLTRLELGINISLTEDQ